MVILFVIMWCGGLLLSMIWVVWNVWIVLIVFCGICIVMCRFVSEVRVISGCGVGGLDCIDLFICM